MPPSLTSLSEGLTRLQDDLKRHQAESDLMWVRIAQLRTKVERVAADQQQVKVAPPSSSPSPS